jgi:hypothetical protein
MNTITLHLFGREILALRVTEPTRTEPEPATDAAETEPETDEGFGFHGGSGGIHQAAWAPTSHRPIDAG